MRRSRSEASRPRRSARRRSLAPICSFDGGVPESELSMRSRRSSSATRSSSRRRSSPLRLQVRAHRGKPLPQRGELSIPGLDYRAQPRDQRTLLPGRAGRIGLIEHKS